MIYGIGVDLIEIDRIKQAIERNGQRFVDRVYTKAEQEYCAQRPSFACYAARFTAKEAFLKALGTGLRKGMRWQDIEVYTDDLGKPHVQLYGYLQERAEQEKFERVHLSLSHSSAYAIAHVIIEQ
jgi:holo-[acyl-carrier protein] synthase